jgi:hypothetical protein
MIPNRVTIKGNVECSMAHKVPLSMEYKLKEAKMTKMHVEKHLLPPKMNLFLKLLTKISTKLFYWFITG